MGGGRQRSGRAVGIHIKRLTFLVGGYGRNHRHLARRKGVGNRSGIYRFDLTDKTQVAAVPGEWFHHE